MSLLARVPKKSRYISVSDFDRNEEKTVTIDRIEDENVDDLSGASSQKAIVYFRDEGIKPMVLNRTNAEALADEFDDDEEKMIGEEIILYVDRNVQMGGKRVGGVRIKIPSELDKRF